MSDFCFDVFFFVFFFKQKTAYEMRISDWEFRRVLFRSKEATDLLNKNINEILQLPEVQKVLAAKGAEAGGGSPADFAKQIREDTISIQKVVDEAGIKIE